MGPSMYQDGNGTRKYCVKEAVEFENLAER